MAETTKKYSGGKLTPSAKIFVTLETAGAVLAAAALIAFVVTYSISANVGLKFMSAAFYPLVICIALSLTTGINQLLRGVHPLALGALILCSLCMFATIGVIIYEVVEYGKFFLAPFVFV